MPRAGLPGPLQAGRAQPAAFEIREGVHIHRVPATSLGRRGTWSRMTDYLSFYGGAAFKALRLPKFDLVVTLTTPPIIGLIGTILKRVQRLSARLLEHGSSSRCQHGVRPDVTEGSLRQADVRPEPLGLPAS